MAAICYWSIFKISPNPIAKCAQECRAAGVKVRFKRIKSGFTVVFFRPKLKKPENVTKTVGGVNGGVNILEAEIKRRPGQRLPGLSTALKVSDRTVEKWLEKLKKTGRIIYRGSYKSGGYFVTGKKRA